MKNPVATMQMANGVQIVIELRPDQAPNTVNSFIHLARLGCFDGHAIERIVPGFVVDASYSAFGREEAKYLIPHETRQKGFDNQLKVEPGKIVMGGYGDMGIAGGEFFFPIGDYERLDGVYPAFGEVVQGWDEIARWEKVDIVPVVLPHKPTMRVNRPVEPIVIEKVTVETFGQEYPAPTTVPITRSMPNWGIYLE